MSKSIRPLALTFAVASLLAACAVGTWDLIVEHPDPFTGVAASVDGEIVYGLREGLIFAYDQDSGAPIGDNLDLWHYPDALAITGAPSHPNTAWSLHDEGIHRWAFDSYWTDAMYPVESIALPGDGVDVLYDLTVDSTGDIYLATGLYPAPGQNQYSILLYRWRPINGQWDAAVWTTWYTSNPLNVRLTADPAGTNIFLAANGQIFDLDPTTLWIDNQVQMDGTEHVSDFMDIDAYGGLILAVGRDNASRGYQGAVGLFEPDGDEVAWDTNFGYPIHSTHMTNQSRSGDVKAWMTPQTAYTGQIWSTVVGS